MHATISDRIALREQQIETCRKMIAWEASHDWGEAVHLAPLSADVIEDCIFLIATLESIISKLKALNSALTTKDKAKAEAGDKVQIEEITPKKKR